MAATIQDLHLQTENYCLQRARMPLQFKAPFAVANMQFSATRFLLQLQKGDEILQHHNQLGLLGNCFPFLTRHERETEGKKCKNILTAVVHPISCLVGLKLSFESGEDTTRKAAMRGHDPEGCHAWL